MLTTPEGRTGSFHVERAYPHKIVRWSWADKAGAPGARLGGGDSGELTGSARLAYWNLHTRRSREARRAPGRCVKTARNGRPT